MPIIRDIQLSLLRKRDPSNSIRDLQVPNIIIFREDEKFFKETRCITSLYSRLIPKLVTDFEKGILIHCVDKTDMLSEWEKQQHIFPEYITVFLKINSEDYFSLSSD